MNKKLISVLDIGSSKVSVLTASAGINNNFIIYGKSDVEYSGFSDGEFFEPDVLADKIGKAIENVELLTKFAIKELTVAVPSEFCYSITKKINITFSKRLRLKQPLIDEIYASGIENIDNHTLISIESIYNILDDGKKIINALNYKTSKLTSYINLIYVKNDFIELLNDILTKLGILKVNYVSSALAEAQALLGETPTEAMIIDIGYLTTSVAVAKGNGLQNLFSFSQGGAHIMSDLAECLEINFKDAEDLKRRIILTLQPTANDYYETSNLSNPRKIFTKVANEIVMSRINYIANFLKVCLAKCENEDYMPIYLTGGGISYIKGAKEELSKQLGQNIGLISPNLVEFNKPYYSSLMSLVSLAIKNSEKQRVLVAK